jgi:hypothetical protein
MMTQKPKEPGSSRKDKDNRLEEHRSKCFGSGSVTWMAERMQADGTGMWMVEVMLTLQPNQPYKSPSLGPWASLCKVDVE